MGPDCYTVCLDQGQRQPTLRRSAVRIHNFFLERSLGSRYRGFHHFSLGLTETSPLLDLHQPVLALLLRVGPHYSGLISPMSVNLPFPHGRRMS
jgi:hypothetical protein